MKNELISKFKISQKVMSWRGLGSCPVDFRGAGEEGVENPSY